MKPSASLAAGFDLCWHKSLSMSGKSVQWFCDTDMRQNNSMSRKSVQRFCDTDMRQNNNLKRQERI